MRILIATSHRSVVGGAEKYLQSVIPGLLERGHQLGFLFEFPSDPKHETIDPSGTAMASWCAEELGLKAILQSVREWSPDVVYLHGLEKPELEASLQDRYPTILYAHNYYGTCVSGQKCHTFPQPRPCGRRLGPQCLAMYYPRRCGGLNPVTTWRLFRQQSERNALLAGYNAILVASRHMFREYQQHGVAMDKLRLVPLPGTDIIPDLMPPAPRAPGGRLLFIGRLIDLKGVSYLIQAVPQAARLLRRPLTLTVAGDGAERPKLQDMAQQFGVTVDFPGWVQTKQKIALMREADLLVVPSLWPEPFGLVGVEAGCLGLPAAAFAVGGIADWLVPGESGEAAPCDPPSPQGLAAAIARALSDPNHYNRLRHGAWRTAQRFSLESHLSNLEAVLSGTAKPLGDPPAVLDAVH